MVPGGPPLDPAALDATGRSFVQVHGVLHDGWKLGLYLRRTDALLKESWWQHKHRGYDPSHTSSGYDGRPIYRRLMTEMMNKE